MIEKVDIQGKDVWIQIEPHITDKDTSNATEYFTVTYYSVNPETAQGGILLVDAFNKPVIFASPVEALEFCTEKLEIHG